MEGFWIILVVFAFVTIIVKMALQHAERIERIKRGYPLEEEMPRKDEYIDYSNRNDKQY